MFDISPCGPGEVTDFTQFFLYSPLFNCLYLRMLEVWYIAQLHYWKERKLLTV